MLHQDSKVVINLFSLLLSKMPIDDPQARIVHFSQDSIAAMLLVKEIDEYYGKFPPNRLRLPWLSYLDSSVGIGSALIFPLLKYWFLFTSSSGSFKIDLNDSDLLFEIKEIQVDFKNIKPFMKH